MLKIEIAINIEIILFIILFILTKQIGLYLLFILFVLIHELCHMIFGIALGFKPKKFIIMPFGFKIEFTQIKTSKKMELKKIVIASAGPAINIVIMMVSIFLNLHNNIIYTNLLIALFNLIPIYPLDGGRILKSILNIKFKSKKSYTITNRVANISVIVLTILNSFLILYLKNIALICINIYLWYVVLRENKRYKIIKRVYEVIESNR